MMITKYNKGDYVTFKDHFGKLNKGTITQATEYNDVYYIRTKERLIPQSNNVEYYVSGQDITGKLEPSRDT